MKFVKFPESNHTYAENQPQYTPLPGYLQHDSKMGEFVMCLQLTWWERVKVFFTGKIWGEVLTFNDPLQPMIFTATKSDVITTVPHEALENKKGPAV